MARLLYSLLFFLLLPLMVIRLLWRSLRSPAYRQRISERFGQVPGAIPHGAIWVHAVSVGESVAAQPLIERLLARYPETPLLMTTTTPTGAAQVKRMFGDRVHHAYLPYDLPLFWSIFFNRVQPRLLVIMETELWPNLLAHCESRRVPAILANARLSEKSARGYRKFSALTVPMLQRLTAIAVQSAADGERFIQLGYPSQRLSQTGSIKFDVAIADHPQQQGQALRQQWGAGRPVLALASSHEGEDELLLECYPRLAAANPGLILMLIPRHPERFDQVAQLIQQYDLTMHRRTEGDMSAARADQVQVYLADTMGEMLPLLSATDVVVMGGSFEPVGGHNPIEPAALGKPVLMGPHAFNFATIVAGLAAHGALETCTATQLNQTLLELFEQRERQIAMGKAGLHFVQAHRGAVDRLEQVISPYLVETHT